MSVSLLIPCPCRIVACRPPCYCSASARGRFWSMSKTMGGHAALADGDMISPWPAGRPTVLEIRIRAQSRLPGPAPPLHCSTPPMKHCITPATTAEDTAVHQRLRQKALQHTTDYGRRHCSTPPRLRQKILLATTGSAERTYIHTGQRRRTINCTETSRLQARTNSYYQVMHVVPEEWRDSLTTR